MAKFVIDGLDDIKAAFEDLALLPESVALNMLDAEAQVIEAAQKEKAKTMLDGPYNKGIIAGAIKRKPGRKKGDGYAQQILIEGTVTDEHHKKPTRIAEIAYINEFGTTTQPGRPFLWEANLEKGDEAARGADRVYDEYLKSKKL